MATMGAMGAPFPLRQGLSMGSHIGGRAESGQEQLLKRGRVSEIDSFGVIYGLQKKRIDEAQRKAPTPSAIRGSQGWAA